jgi:hypothetical protein
MLLKVNDKKWCQNDIQLTGQTIVDNKNTFPPLIRIANSYAFKI